MLKDYGRVVGPLKVFIEKAANIPNDNTFKLLGAKVDPFCVVFLSMDDTKQIIKTDVKKNDLQPVWNYKGNLLINTRMRQAKELKLVVQIQHAGSVTNDILGQCEIPL